MEGRGPHGIVPQDALSQRTRDELHVGALRESAGSRRARHFDNVEDPSKLPRAARGEPPDLSVYFGDLAWRALGTIGTGDVLTAGSGRQVTRAITGGTASSWAGTSSRASESFRSSTSVTSLHAPRRDSSAHRLASPGRIGPRNECAIARDRTRRRGSRCARARVGRAATPALHSLLERGTFARAESAFCQQRLSPTESLLPDGREPGPTWRIRLHDPTTDRVWPSSEALHSTSPDCGRATRRDRASVRIHRIPRHLASPELTRSVFISGWDLPVSFEADSSFSYGRGGLVLRSASASVR